MDELLPREGRAPLHARDGLALAGASAPCSPLKVQTL